MKTPMNSPSNSPRATRVDHLGLAVRSIDSALPFFRDVLGLREVPLTSMDGARIVGLAAGDALVELLEPRSDESPIARFMEKRGPGIHHVCLAVDNLDAMLTKCRAAGIALVDDVPRVGAEGKRIAFLHPKSTGGILVELTEY
jgi:methylmalonyl-CoA/ethylmalonyl-CoA epimerase